MLGPTRSNEPDRSATASTERAQSLPLNSGDKPKTARPTPSWKAFEGEPPPTARPSSGPADERHAKPKG